MSKGESTDEGKRKSVHPQIIAAIITGIFSVLSVIAAVLANNYMNSAEEQLKKVEAKVKDEIPIGTIIVSLLPPNEFYRQVGDPEIFDRRTNKWCYADGQTNISGTAYSEFYTKNLIDDLRGYFLRGLDKNGQVDPDGRRRTIGDIQDDAFQGHHHMVDTKPGGVTLMVEQGGQAPLSYNYNHWSPAAKGAVSDGRNGEPRISSENRPRNVSVNYFIKIR